MNIGTISCIAMAVIFGSFAIIFGMLKDKATILISGFNSLQEQERDKFDKVKMSIDYRNIFIIWTVIFIVGIIASYFINAYLAIIAFCVWLVTFFKSVHMQTDKAFVRYRK